MVSKGALMRASAWANCSSKTAFLDCRFWTVAFNCPICCRMAAIFCSIEGATVEPDPDGSDDILNVGSRVMCQCRYWFRSLSRLIDGLLSTGTGESGSGVTGRDGSRKL